jgi:hypothetical protein
MTDTGNREQGDHCNRAARLLLPTRNFAENILGLLSQAV